MLGPILGNSGSEFCTDGGTDRISKHALLDSFQYRLGRESLGRKIDVTNDPDTGGSKIMTSKKSGEFTEKRTIADESPAVQQVQSLSNLLPHAAGSPSSPSSSTLNAGATAANTPLTIMENRLVEAQLQLRNDGIRRSEAVKLCTEMLHLPKSAAHLKYKMIASM